jgi:CBS domain-containing protein
MKVADLMTTDLVTCTPDTNLAEAAKRMWDRDCGILPVVDRHGHVAGLITDRDICMAVATKHRPASRISVSEVTAGRVVTVAPADDVEIALQRMAAHQVRRLPAIDQSGALKGIVSLNDIVLYGNGLAASPEAVVEAMRRVCAHRKTAVTLAKA